MLISTAKGNTTKRLSLELISDILNSIILFHLQLHISGKNPQRTEHTTPPLPDRKKYEKYVAVGEGVSRTCAVVNAVWDYMDLLIKDGHFVEDQLPKRPSVNNFSILFSFENYSTLLTEHSTIPHLMQTIFQTKKIICM